MKVGDKLQQQKYHEQCKINLKTVLVYQVMFYPSGVSVAEIKQTITKQQQENTTNPI